MADAVRPGSEAEAADLIRGAAGALRIVGGGTRFIGDTAGTTVGTSGMAGIVLHDPGALTLVARAGTALAEIEAALAAERQMLAFEPPDFRGLLGRGGVSTIGGVVAANASGPRRISGGAARDSLIGVRFVDGSGMVVKNGGRVMKNVTGLDLARLMAGARGTLGLLTEVAFRVLPQPEQVATLVLPVAEPGQAVAVMAAAMASPFDVTGAAWAGGEVLLRIEGFAASVAYRCDALRQRLGLAGAIEPGAARWPKVRDVAAFQGHEGDVWRLSVKPSDAPGIIAKAGADVVMLDWAGGLIWLLVEPGIDLRARIGAFGGHATRMRGDSAGIATFHPEPAPVARLTAGLKARFDPKGLLNPGLLGQS